MQNTWLNILILGLLVLLFAAMYRKKATPRLRYWIAGWLFVLLHFAVLTLSPATQFWIGTQNFVCIGSLLMTGVCFLLASSAFSLSGKDQFLVAMGTGFFSLLFVFLVSYGFTKEWLVLVIALAGEAAPLLVGRRVNAPRPVLQWANIVTALACGAWLIGTVLVSRPQLGVYPILTQFFLMNAVLFCYDFRRLSAGSLACAGGLFAWAAVFPAYLLLEHYFPGHHIPSDLWNVPKYFVEFGMILTLLENQVYAANWQREQYRLLFDANPYPMFIYDAKTLAFLRVNDAALMLYGYSREEFLSLKVCSLHDVAAAPGMDPMMAEAGLELQHTGPWAQKKKDGSRFMAEISTHSIEFDSRRARFSMVRDVTDRQRLHDQLVHQAHHDSLTDLPNRVLFEQRMVHTLENATRYGHRAAILCIDLDRFKQVNDTYGHAAGDACLQEVARRFRTRLRESDTVARTGGEEFTVVVGELLYSADAEKVASDLLACLQRPMQIAGVEVSISASIGVAIYPDHGTDGKKLWRAADLVMYHAKFSGGNRFLMAEANGDAISPELLAPLDLLPSQGRRTRR